MLNIAIIGPGFVGLSSAVVYAHLGHQITGVDIDQKKVDLLNQGVVSFYEPKLTEMVQESLQAGKLNFTTDYAQAIPQADLIIISVGTPSSSDGAVDLSYLDAALKSLAPHLKNDAIIAIKSTVPPGTLDRAAQILADQNINQKYYLASLPEFLKEGTAVDDTLYPDRILIGATDEFVFQTLEDLHRPLKAPMLRMKPASAQLAKYAGNNYLAMRISFINQIADFCPTVGADIEEVISAIGHDRRIGNHYWYPGFGYGGSCFPKDVKGLNHLANQKGFTDNLFGKIDQLNEERPAKLLDLYGQKITGGWQDKKVAVLGLSFKPNTDDQRVAPALQIIPYLLEHQTTVVSYDPMVKEIASTAIANDIHYQQASSIEAAIDQAEVIIALVEWPQIVGYKFPPVTGDKPVYFIDARNQFEPTALQAAGYQYFGVGR